MSRQQDKYKHKATAHEYAIELLTRAQDNGICADEHPDIQKEFSAIIKRLVKSQERNTEKSKEDIKPLKNEPVFEWDNAITKFGKR